MELGGVGDGIEVYVVVPVLEVILGVLSRAVLALAWQQLSAIAVVAGVVMGVPSSRSPSGSRVTHRSRRGSTVASTCCSLPSRSCWAPFSVASSIRR